MRVAHFLNPSGYFIAYAEGVSSFYRGRCDDAIDKLKKAVKINPHFPLPFLYLAFAEEEMKHDTLQSEIYRDNLIHCSLPQIDLPGVKFTKDTGGKPVPREFTTHF